MSFTPLATAHRLSGIHPFLRRIACIGLAVTLSGVPAGPAVAASAGAEHLAGLVVPGFAWEAPQAMQLSGVPMHVRYFSADMVAAAAAQALAQHSGLFQRALKLNARIVLSGLHSGWHWLAQVDGSTTGSKGYVSVLHADAAHAEKKESVRIPSFPWLPPQARRQFEHLHTRAGKTVLQQVYSVTLPAQTLTSYLRRQLRAEGWMPEPELAGLEGGMTWRRAGARLLVLPRQESNDASLYVHYSE